MVEFTAEFNVEEKRQTSDWVTYRQFIEHLRRQLGERSRFSHNLPVLPPQQNPCTQWFDIVLRTNSYSIRLRIRLDDLYLDGYQMENNDQWLEFGSNTTNPPSPHLITGSSFPGFDGGYNDLQRVSGARMDAINLGQPQLTIAVNQLVTSESGQERARSLIIVIQMICESIRFCKISDYLAAEFRGSLPSNLMLALEHGWEDLSAKLLRCDANPENPFRLPQSNDMQIEMAKEAVAVLGILLGSNFGPRASVRVPRMAVINDGQCFLGRPLVEVFSVCINNIDGENPGQLYGTITVTDGLSCQYIYNREREHYESIQPLDIASLTGPARSISAYGSFTIDVDLKDYDSLSPDDEVSRGQISWNVFHTTNEYDKPLFDRVDGTYGRVTVNYAVLSIAVEAIVEVMLINGDGENPADVYGQLTARIDKFMNESVLFRKTVKEPIEVRPGQLIPLSRSVVAVPLNSSLIVQADLWDHDIISPNDEIAKGLAKFPAQLSGTSEINISGDDGEIQVKVTWRDM